MIHEILPVGMLQCNCSVLGEETTREAMVIDPGDGVGQILEVLARHSLKVTSIVITHAHIDHIGGVRELRSATGAPVHMNANDDELLDDLDAHAAMFGIEKPGRIEVDSRVRDGDTLRVGATGVTVLHTPGHTQGSISLWIPAENKLISGDTLFRDGIGRTDFPGGDSRQILASIRDKLFPLPDEAAVFPGHGPSTTIGREKQSNSFLKDL